MSRICIIDLSSWFLSKRSILHYKSSIYWDDTKDILYILLIYTNTLQIYTQKRFTHATVNCLLLYTWLFSRKCWQGISHGGNFHNTTPISFTTTYGFYFRVGVIYAKKTKAWKTRKLPPHENFHVYSICERFIFMIFAKRITSWI